MGGTIQAESRVGEGSKFMFTLPLLPDSQPKRAQVSVEDLTGLRVLIVDEWSETGAQLEAAVHLCREAGATVVGVAVLNADEAARKRLPRCAGSRIATGG